MDPSTPAPASASSSSRATVSGRWETKKEELLKSIRALGRLPKRHPQATEQQPELFRENKLAECYKNMKWRFTTEEQAELCSLPQDLDAKATTLAAIRNLGRMPSQHPKATEAEPELLAEHRLAESLKHFRRVNKLTAEEEQELGHLEAAGLEDATAAPDPDEKFAAEAANRLDQTLLMLSDGICTKAVVQRARTYKRLLAKPGARLTQWAQVYGQRIEAAVIQGETTGGAVQPAGLGGGDALAV